MLVLKNSKVSYFCTVSYGVGKYAQHKGSFIQSSNTTLEDLEKSFSNDDFDHYDWSHTDVSFKIENMYSLFEGRHELPFNKGAIFSSFSFDKREGVKTSLYNELLNEGGMLIVTGLTPALTEFLSEFSNSVNFKKNKLTLLHFDSNTKTYWEQSF
jgi:hypothetical protein